MSDPTEAAIMPTLRDLEQRLQEKRATLDRMADRHPDWAERARLWGKASGVGLALSFVQEAIREHENGRKDTP